jgi:hypothetical protein
LSLIQEAVAFEYVEFCGPEELGVQGLFLEVLLVLAWWGCFLGIQ